MRLILVDDGAMLIATLIVRRKSLVKHIRCLQLAFEIGWTRQHKSRHVRFVCSNKHLHGQFCYFSDIVMTFLQAETCKSESRLTPTTMPIGQTFGNQTIVHDFHFLGRSTENLCNTSLLLHCSVPIKHCIKVIAIRTGIAIKWTVAIHNNEPELFVILQEFI